MTQLALDIRERFALLQHETRVGMPEAMGRKMERQPGLRQHVPHGALHFAFIHRRPRTCTKDPGRPRRTAQDE